MSSKFDNRTQKLMEELALQEVAVDTRPDVPAAASLPARPDLAALRHGHHAETELTSEEAVRPPVDIAETGEVVLFTIDVPGMEQDDVEVLINPDILTVRGKRPEPTDTITTWHLQERSRALIERVLLIPEGVDTDDATFQVRNGVLTVRMSRTARPRKGVVFAS